MIEAGGGIADVLPTLGAPLPEMPGGGSFIHHMYQHDLQAGRFDLRTLVDKVGQGLDAKDTAKVPQEDQEEGLFVGQFGERLAWGGVIALEGIGESEGPPPITCLLVVAKGAP